ncbi:hypothetical protein U3516DRAFT_888248 [Neocallimastix sp. 'constans']|jgi:hypothetical protein
MIANTTSRNILKYILLLSSIKYIDNIRAENQCTSNLECAKLNTGVDSHVCIRWDGQKDYVCYLEAEAYCDKDATCQGFSKALKFCYVPPWITNKNSQKQCFSVHSEGGTCVEDKHCNKGLVCLNNICTGSTNANANSNKMDNTNTKGNANTKTDNKNNNTNKNSNKNTNSTSSITFDYNDEEEEVKKDEPIEIIGLPLWGFITIVTIPVIFIIAIVWCLSIGRRSYREEEEKKRNKMVLKNNKKDLETNYKGASSEKHLAESTSSSDYKGEMLKSYVNGDGSGAVTTISSSSNSTIANNITVVPGFSNLINKSSQSSLDVPKFHKKKKSNSNLAATVTTAAENTTTTTTKTKASTKPKKLKSTVGSEYSDSNSHRALLANGMSATDSGVYSNYFSGAGSTVSSSYFGQPMAASDAMNAYYYQQMIAAQQLQAQQLQSQALMNQYYMENAAAAMPTVEMMQYQQLYGAGMMNGAMLNNPMLYAGSDVGSTDSIPRKSKAKHKK